MQKLNTIPRILLILLLGGALILGISRYNVRRSQSKNLNRVAFALNIDKLPPSLTVESAHVDNWNEYHLVMACRDRTGTLDYLLAGRKWEVIAKSPPWRDAGFKDNKDLMHTIVREANWHEGEKTFAAVRFDQDGERFIVEYHAL